jgi:TfoX/Sxy family transcriptional regulator of competence genes
MAYDAELAGRVRELVAGRDGAAERKMFGGIAFLVHGNMACGVLGDELIARLAHDEAEAALREPGIRPFDVTGRPLRGFVFVDADLVADDRELAQWVDAAANHAASLPPK